MQTTAVTVHIPPQWQHVHVCLSPPPQYTHVCLWPPPQYTVCVPKSPILRMRHAILRCDQGADDGCLDEQALRFTYGLPDYVLLTLSHSLTFSRRTLLAPLYLLVYDCAYCGCTHYDAQAFCMAMHLAASRAEAPAQVRLYSREMREAVREALLYLAVGAEVTVRGLESRPDLNGATARVQRWDAQSGRYTVEMLRLASGVKPAAADTSKALKPKNLKPADAGSPLRPPPPPPPPLAESGGLPAPLSQEALPTPSGASAKAVQLRAAIAASVALTLTLASTLTLTLALTLAVVVVVALTITLALALATVPALEP